MSTTAVDGPPPQAPPSRSRALLVPAMAAGRTPGRSKMRSVEELNAALKALGSAPVPGGGAIDDHRADALLAAAWLRGNAARAELWQPNALTANVARTEGWTFGAL